MRPIRAPRRAYVVTHVKKIPSKRTAWTSHPAATGNVESAGQRHGELNGDDKLLKHHSVTMLRLRCRRVSMEPVQRASNYLRQQTTDVARGRKSVTLTVVRTKSEGCMASACGQPRCQMAASVACWVTPLRVAARHATRQWISVVELASRGL